MTYTREVTRSMDRGYETLFKRSYTLHFLKPDGDRAAAIAALSAKGHLYPQHDFLQPLDALEAKEAQAFLRANPVLERFDAYYVHDLSFSDADMGLLRQLPELARLHLRSTAVTDQGVEALESLQGLRDLLLYASGVTDSCLESLARMPALAVLDLQGSPRISAAALSAYKAGAHLDTLYEPTVR